jgi:hypothetical protein
MVQSWSSNCFQGCQNCFWEPSVSQFFISYERLARCHGRGREFESRRPRHSFEWITKNPEKQSGSVWVQ